MMSLYGVVVARRGGRREVILILIELVSHRRLWNNNNNNNNNNKKLSVYSRSLSKIKSDILKQIQRNETFPSSYRSLWPLKTERCLDSQYGCTGWINTGHLKYVAQSEANYVTGKFTDSSVCLFGICLFVNFPYLIIRVLSSSFILVS